MIKILKNIVSKYLTFTRGVQNIPQTREIDTPTIRETRLSARQVIKPAADSFFGSKGISPLRFTSVEMTIKKTDGRLRECLSTLVSIQPRSKNEYYHHQTEKSRKQKLNQNAK